MTHEKEAAAHAEIEEETPSTEPVESTADSVAHDSSSEAPVSLEVERLRKELEAEKARSKDLQEQLLRSAADFDNYRKRIQRDQTRQADAAQESTIKKLLPIVDNLERSLAHLRTATKLEGIKEGHEAIYRQCLDALTSLGVTPMEAVGGRFDPNLHEALTQQVSAEHPDGTVLQMFETGYMIRDRVLRHAKVVVSKAPEDAAPAEPHVPGGSPTPN
jgi:molecular chaperone GrpE